MPLPGGGQLYVLGEQLHRAPAGRAWTAALPDNRILAAACALNKAGADVIFVSKDINARVKADALGIRAEDFLNRVVNFDELYNGWSEHVVADEVINAFYAGEPP